MTGILILLFVAIIILECCNGNKQRCYTVDGKDICYFQPDGTNTNRTWETASQACKKNNSTLPAIENKTIQETLEGYLKDNSSLSQIWLAGRQFLTNDWRWLNGKLLSNQARVTKSGNKNYAYIRKELNYTSESVSGVHNYICQYRDNTSCQSKADIVPRRSGCIVVYNNESMNFNKAREKCLDGGGYLATFEDDEHLTVFSSHPGKLGNKTYWIGMSRFLWIWNITESTDQVNYNAFSTSKINITDKCRLMKSVDHTLKQVQCNDSRRVDIVCQTVSSLENVITDKSTQISFAIWPHVPIIIGAAVGLVIIVALIFSCRKLCKKEANDERDRLSDGNQTHPNECKGVDETTEMCGLYAEVTRKEYDEDNGNNINEPQTGIMYATLEFANNKVAKEASVTRKPHKIKAASAPAKSVGETGISQVHALDVNIYSEIISRA